MSLFQLVEKGAFELLMLGIPAGFLIAALAWMLPSAEGGKIWAVIIITYMIALGDLAHVVAGAVEVFVMLIAGQISLWHAFGAVLLPMLIGNILGGTALFSLIAYAQVREEDVAGRIRRRTRDRRVHWPAGIHRLAPDRPAKY